MKLLNSLIKTLRNLKFLAIVATAILIGISSVFIYYNILSLDDIHPGIQDTHQSNTTASQDNNGAEMSEIQDSSGTSNSPSQNPASPPSAQVTKGWYLHVNLDELKMHVYNNGQHLKTYPVSGGKRSTPSPQGTWKIISKDTWGEGFGGGWLGFNVPYGKFGIHGTKYPWVIGKSNSSKGCIRMKNSDLLDLYRMVPHGATVTIVQNNQPFRILKSGDIGSDVVAVQAALKKLGYYKGSTDGKFGSGLKSSVQKFQKANRLTASGKVDKKTYNLILEAAGKQ